MGKLWEKGETSKEYLHQSEGRDQKSDSIASLCEPQVHWNRWQVQSIHIFDSTNPLLLGSDSSHTLTHTTVQFLNGRVVLQAQATYNRDN